MLRAAKSGAPCPETRESCRERPYLDPESLDAVGAFKTASLRNVATTAPYMHDGRFATLSEVVGHYRRLDGRPAIGTRTPLLSPQAFTIEEETALLDFLGSLSSDIIDYGLNEKLTGSSGSEPATP